MSLRLASPVERLFIAFIGFFLLAVANSMAAPDSSSPKKPNISRNPAATFSDVSYGNHPRQTLDFWQAKSAGPTPVVFFLHGGGWVRGDKSGVKRVQEFLDAGISVVAANYRYIWQAQDEGVNPPVKAPMEDAKRALQFLRSKAGEWNIDPARIGGWGGSAGACSLLWLALHEDMADPRSSDPVARESTRLYCVGLDGVQTTLDPKLMREWTPNSTYGAHAFGFPDSNDRESISSHFDEFLARRDELLPLIEEYSPFSHASADDPPMLLVYDERPALGRPVKDPTHSANFGVMLREKLQPLGVDCQLAYGKRVKTHEYLIQRLAGLRADARPPQNLAPKPAVSATP